MSTAAPAAAGDAAAAASAAADLTATAAGAPSPADAAAAAAATAAAAAPAAPAAGAQTTDTTGWPQAAIDAFTRRDADAVRYQREAGDQRINAKTKAADDARAEILAQITQALNPGAAGGAAPTVEGLTGQLGEMTTANAAAAMDAATVKAAWAAGINPTKLGFLQYQLGQDKTIDPAAPDFAAKLTSSIAALVAADPTFKLTGSAVASSVESLGGSTGSATITPEAFAGMSIMAKSDLYKTDKATYDKLSGAAQ